MSTPLPLMATVNDTACQGGDMERIYKVQQVNRLETNRKMENMRFKTTYQSMPLPPSHHGWV